MTSPSVTETRAELFRALGVLAEPPGTSHGRLADLLGLPTPERSDWTEAFVVQLVPHASIYLGADGMLGGEAADRVAGFWRALRLPVPADPDHLTALLGLYANLIDQAANEPTGPRQVLWRQARTALLHEHLLSWLPTYLHAMRRTGPPPYAAWAELLYDALLDEVAAVGAPDRLPAHLRDLPPIPGAGDGLEEFVAGLLTPVRSGLVLTRADLARAARSGGLALRLGERSRVLRALLQQDPAGTLGWLSEHARQWEAQHRADRTAAGPAAVFRADRATASAALLAAATQDHKKELR